MTALRLPSPVAFVFTSGLARSAAQVGMVKTLHAHGITPDIAVGTSLGAINAAAVAENADSAVTRLEQVWHALGAERAVSSLLRAVVRGAAQSQANRQARQLREIIAEAVPPTPIDDLQIPFIAVATDLASGHPRALTQGPTIDAVMASCALPAILPPVARDGELLIDGALVAGVPVDQALERGAGSIVVFDTGDPSVGEDAAAALRWWEVAAVSYGYQVRGQMVHALARAGQHVPVIVVSTNQGSMLDFTKPGEVLAAGELAAEAALADLPAQLRVGVYGIPSGLEGLPSLERVLVTDW